MVLLVWIWSFGAEIYKIYGEDQWHGYYEFDRLELKHHHTLAR